MSTSAKETNDENKANPRENIKHSAPLPHAPNEAWVFRVTMLYYEQNVAFSSNGESGMSDKDVFWVMMVGTTSRECAMNC